MTDVVFDLTINHPMRSCPKWKRSSGYHVTYTISYFIHYLPKTAARAYIHVPETGHKAPTLDATDFVDNNNRQSINDHTLPITMTTLAGMAFGETPERVLKRVQELEDVELPSLPSFSHDMDCDSEVDQTEDERSVEQADKSEAVRILFVHIGY